MSKISAFMRGHKEYNKTYQNEIGFYSSSDNPYPKGGFSHQDYRYGFVQAREEHLESMENVNRV